MEKHERTRTDETTYQRCIQRIRVTWPSFLEKRQLRLQQQHRNGGIASEKVAENILEDLFTMVLDWDLSDLNNQLECNLTHISAYDSSALAHSACNDEGERGE